MAKPPFSPMFAVGWSDGLASVATERDAAIQRRYHSLLRARRAGVSWGAALEGTLRELPLPPTAG
jgi:hypothetical protein